MGKIIKKTTMMNLLNDNYYINYNKPSSDNDIQITYGQ